MARKKVFKDGLGCSLTEMFRGVFPGMSEEEIEQALLTEIERQRQGKLPSWIEKDLKKKHASKVLHVYDKKSPSLCDMTVASQQYVLAIKIENCPMRVYRQLEVPSNIRLEHLAEIIIEAVGWFGDHLHQFTKGNVNYVSPHEIEEAPDWSWAMEQMDAMGVTLGDVLKKKGDTIRFEYDFGDSWYHQVRLSSVKPLDESRVKLLKGVGGCPPEDCGGVWGYREVLESGEYEPEEFDLEDAASCVDNYVASVNAPGYMYMTRREKYGF